MFFVPCEQHVWHTWRHFWLLVVLRAIEAEPDAPETLSEWPVACPVVENAAILDAQRRCFCKLFWLLGALFF